MKSKARKSDTLLRMFCMLVMILALCGSAYLGYKAWIEIKERKASGAYYQKLAESSSDNTEVMTEEIQENEKTEVKSFAVGGESLNPNTEYSGNSEVDFGRIWKTCPDVVAWIRFDNTVINYPVVQGEDNSFYLSHLPDGTKNASGSIMMDVSNYVDFSNTITVLHGHHMRNGDMFGSLEKLAKQRYFEDHPTFYLYTPECDYTVEVIVAWTTSARASGYPTEFSSQSALDEFFAGAKAEAAYSTESDISINDHMVLLSTCAYTYSNARFVVIGRLIPY